VTWPSSQSSDPDKALNNVVFPAPFGPIRPPMTPSGMSKLTPSTAVKPPKRLVILDKLSIAGTPTFPLSDVIKVVLHDTTVPAILIPLQAIDGTGWS